MYRCKNILLLRVVHFRDNLFVYFKKYTSCNPWRYSSYTYVMCVVSTKIPFMYIFIFAYVHKCVHVEWNGFVFKLNVC